MDQVDFCKDNITQKKIKCLNIDKKNLYEFLLKRLL